MVSLLFAGMAGLFGLVTAIFEISIGNHAPEQWLYLLQAVCLFVLVFGFAVWVLRPVSIFAPAPARLKPSVPDITPGEHRRAVNAARIRS